jgi:hypothetical protein
MLSPGSTAMPDMSKRRQTRFSLHRSGWLTAAAVEFQPVQIRDPPVLPNYVVKDIETLDKLCAGQLAKEIQAMYDPELPEERSMSPSSGSDSINGFRTAYYGS